MSISIIVWFGGVGLLALVGGFSIGYGLGVYWLFRPQDPTAQSEPGVLGAWPPILGTLTAHKQEANEGEG